MLLRWWRRQDRWRRGAAVGVVSLGLGETLDLQRVRKLEEVVEVGLLNLDLPLVHEEEEVADDLLSGVLEHNDGVLFRKGLKEPVKVLTAGSENHPVSCHGLAVGAGEADVHQGVGVEQVLEGGERVEAVVVPLQVELLGVHGSADQGDFFFKVMLGKQTNKQTKTKKLKLRDKNFNRMTK